MKGETGWKWKFGKEYSGKGEARAESSSISDRNTAKNSPKPIIIKNNKKRGKKTNARTIKRNP